MSKLNRFGSRMCQLSLLTLLPVMGCGRGSGHDAQKCETGSVTQSNDSLPMPVMHTETSPFPKHIKRAPTEPNSLEHWLYLGMDVDSERTTFVKDKNFPLVTPRIHGDALVWVNGSPVLRTARTGQMERISDWLRSGRNTITVSGKHERDFYVKVILLRNPFFATDRFEKVLAKQWLSYTKGDSPDDTSFSFDVTLDYEPYFDRLDSDDQSSEGIEAEVREYLGRFTDAIREHDYEKYMCVAYAPWSERPQWGTPQDGWRNPRWRSAIQNKAVELMTRVDDFELKIGSHSVLATSGRTESIFPTEHDGYYGLKWRNTANNKCSHADPLVLVRVGGRWEINR